MFNKTSNLMILVLCLALIAGLGFYVAKMVAPAPQPTEQDLGGQAGPDSTNPYYSYAGVQYFAQRYACNTASSTIWAIPNPFNASSTLEYISVQGTMGATTSDIVFATSSVLSPAYTTTTATSSLNENIMGMQVAASEQFNSVAGVTIGGAGYKNPTLNGFVSNARVGLAPGIKLIAFSTSTAPGGAGGRAAGQVSVPSSCYIEVRIVKN